MSAQVRLTYKQRALLGYMQSNGCVLTDEGRCVLMRRGTWTPQSIGMVATALALKGLLTYEEYPLLRLTEEGRRA